MPATARAVHAAAAALLALAALPRGAQAQIEPPVIAHAELWEVASGSVVNLRLGSTVRIRGTDLHVTFEQVTEDSRCPVNVTCVWAGQAAVELRIRLGDGAELSQTLVLPAGTATVLEAGPLLVRDASLGPPRDPTRPLQPYVLRLRLAVEE